MRFIISAGQLKKIRQLATQYHLSVRVGCHTQSDAIAQQANIEATKPLYIDGGHPPFLTSQASERCRVLAKRTINKPFNGQAHRLTEYRR